MIRVNDGPFSEVVKKAEDRLIPKKGGNGMAFVLEN